MTTDNERTCACGEIIGFLKMNADGSGEWQRCTAPRPCFRHPRCGTCGRTNDAKHSNSDHEWINEFDVLPAKVAALEAERDEKDAALYEYESHLLAAGCATVNELRAKRESAESGLSIAVEALREIRERAAGRRDAGMRSDLDQLVIIEHEAREVLAQIAKEGKE